MNKIFKGIIIFLTTLAVGFSITSITFNLFDTLTQNQMRFLFAMDIVMLLIIGSAVLLKSSSRKCRLKREKELERRHNSRIEKRQAEMKDIEIIIAKNKFAA